MPELIDRLQSAVGDTYRIERELGGGGMSRVFVAREVRLDRRVVIKLLPPEMAAGVSVERFEREILVAAKLQHPHVVSLLTTGSHDDLLYYVMPLIEGESLRAKLSREGELPIGEALSILREVADALAYAHRHGVVHRDIKPDNILLADGHALVTDFGVAKAVSESTGEASLTSMGVALGTPAYMSPEQAAANPHVDHRADIYALGVLAYEMLCGRTPFAESSPQALLAAHVTQQPEPCTTHRSSVSPALNDVVMRCLVKLPADRWQSADELKQQFEAMTTPSGGVTPTGTQPVASVSAELAVEQNHPLRVAGLFGLAAIGALAIVYLLMTLIGLPDWVFYGAIGLLAIGLPIVLFTGHHERRRAVAQTTGLSVATPTGVQRHFTWRKSVLGGGLAFLGLAVVTGGYMTMRGLGIGPVGTLVASGVLQERQPILLAEFANRTADSTLGPSVTDAFRVDLSQSPVVRLVDASVTAAALARMARDPNAALDLALAHEVAEREGITAVVSGEIGPVGRGYVLTASVLSAPDGEVLAAVRETAADDGQIIAAIDRLSAKLRERIGESLRTIRANPPLDRVSTGSIEALRKYSQAIRADQANNQDRALALLEEATVLDTAFAMAYRKQAVILSNTFAEQSRVNTASAKAYEHRDRLSEVERYLTIAAYHDDVEFDVDTKMDAYRAVLEIDSTERTSLNNLALALNQLRQWEEAEALALRGLEHHDINVLYVNAMWALVGQGKYGDATALVERFFAGRTEGDPFGLRLQGQLRAAMQDYDGAGEAFSAILETQRSLTWRAGGTRSLAAIAEIQGQLGAAGRRLRQLMDVEEQRGVLTNFLEGAVSLGSMDVRTRGRAEVGIQIVEEALALHPLETLAPADRPYPSLITLYADAGRSDRARALMNEFESEVPEAVRRGDINRHTAVGALALAEQRYEDAIGAFQARYDAGGGCAFCSLHRLGEAYERSGEPDSALAVYERAVNADELYRMYTWADAYAPTLKRVGEMYEERGDSDKAVEYYNRFVELWEDADAELQPQVEDVRGRIARLVGERR